MSLNYVHLSDIHFGQGKGADSHVHDDIKSCLLDDLSELKEGNGIAPIAGVIVTGDVAFSGKESEYAQAGEWLDQMTQALECAREDVMLVPGNHDVERKRITRLETLMVADIVKNGSDRLECFLGDRVARELLYDKFHDYRAFAAAYDCNLDTDGGVAVTRRAELAPGRDLRFIGLNSALLCGKNGRCDEGNLLIGGKQRVLPRADGHELVVLCHHPLDSLRDRESAERYLRSRARVHIYGHRHYPSVRVEPTTQGADLLTISAGAVVPPSTEDGYQYTYNLICFKWNANVEQLEVRILLRTWNEEETRFRADTREFGNGEFHTTLRGPHSRGGAPAKPAAATTERVPASPVDSVLSRTATGSDKMSNSRLLRVKFFRDLNSAQRRDVLIEVGILARGWSFDLTHVLEIQLFDKALESGLHEGLEAAVRSFLIAEESAEMKP